MTTKKKRSFLSKLKHIISNSGDDEKTSGNSLRGTRSHRSSLNSESASTSFGVQATRTRSKSSFIFGSSHSKVEKEEKNAEALLEERRSKCMAIKLAKRDPPAVQRLLVDCEFCNPPPQFGRNFHITSPKYTSEDTKIQLQQLEQMKKPLTEDNEREWNSGLKEWLGMRSKWLTTTSDAQPVHHLEKDLTNDKFYTVYEKLIYQTRPFKHPLNLSDLVQILKGGWIGEGAWPENPDVQVWSTSEDENTELAKNKVEKVIKEVGEDEEEEKEAKIPTVHVQFSESPHPREVAGSKTEMAPLSRVQSSLGLGLQPVISSQSSVVSITDSE